MRLRKLTITLTLIAVICGTSEVIGQSRKLLDSLYNVSLKSLTNAKYKDEDAVMLLQYRTVYNHYEVNKNYFVYYNPLANTIGKHSTSVEYNASQGYFEHLYQRIKILTQKGAEDYSKIYIPKSTVGKVINISAKTIKPDGKTIEVKQEDIKAVESMTNGVFDWKQSHYRFSIPGVEEGDELEIKYTISKPGYINVSGDYFFSTYLPVIQSTIQLIFSNAIAVNVKNYNGLKSPENGISHNSYWFTYSRYNLGALRDIDHSILYNDMPYCRYQISAVHSQFDTSPQGNKVSENNWTDFSKSVCSTINSTNLKDSKSKYFKKYISQYYTPGNEIPQVVFRRLIRLIFDSISVENSNENPEYTSGYYLYKRVIPMAAVYRLYTDLFTELGIEYQYCLGSLKFRGHIDTSMVSGGDFSSLFFAYKDEKDSVRFTFPENSVLKINPEEISPYYYGAQCIMISPNIPGKHSFRKLPDYPYTVNFKKRKNQVHVDLDNNLLTYDCQTVKAGALAYIDKLFGSAISKDSSHTEMKNYFKNDMKNFSLDTSYFAKPDSSFPYKSVFYYKGIQKEKLVKVSDGLYSFDLSEWLDHSVLPVYSNDRFVDYYPDFMFQEQFSYAYIFKFPVEVQNPSALAGGINAGFGSYQFSVNQPSDTVVIVQSTYKIVKDKLPSYQYSQLKQLYDQWALFKNTSLLIRVKPNGELKETTN